jgi:hypothetical protein
MIEDALATIFMYYNKFIGIFGDGSGRLLPGHPRSMRVGPGAC